MTTREAKARGLDVEWMAGVGWCGPDWRDAESLEREHHYLCHGDGSACEDGCDRTADPVRLAKYRACYDCPHCGNDCAGECDSVNWDRERY